MSGMGLSFAFLLALSVSSLFPLVRAKEVPMGLTFFLFPLRDGSNKRTVR